MLKNIAIAMLSLAFIIAGPATTEDKGNTMPGKKEKKEKVKDEYQTKPGKKEKPLYRNVAKDLLSSPKKLTRLEKNALEGFLGKRNMSSAAKRSSIKHLESAMKKHPCFLASSKKNKNMSRWPKADEKALWFTIDCKKQNDKDTN